MPRVLIIGAGPVGLLTALRLGQAGIKIDVLEKEPSLSEEPRAIGYYSSALIPLLRAGVLEDLVKIGFEGKGLCWRKPLVDDGKGGKKLGDTIAWLPVPTKTDQPHGVDGTLYLPQSEMNKLLFRRVLETGNVNVHFNTRLTSIEQKEDEVRVMAETLDPKIKRVEFRADFLVGADGGRSTTRKILDIRMKGHSWPEYIVATDFYFQMDDVDPDFPTSLIVHPIHYGLLTPINQFKKGERTLYRCSVGLDPSETRSPEELTSESFVNSLLEQMLPGPRPLQFKVKKSSAYRTHQLCASTFRRGRCILAGDAAHLNHPWGAMGLTTGLIDSEAAADALEIILLEGKSPDILDIYAQERQRAFQFFVSPYSTQNKLRVLNRPENARDDWLLGKLSQPVGVDAVLRDYGQPYQDKWRTDIRKLIEEAAL
ncbi:hypothetical protein Plec18170_007882 [Paecilomyces lecythidis]